MVYMWPIILEYLNSLGHWDWFALALLLLLLEVFVSAVFFLWFGISAAVVGVLVLVAPHLSWQTQLLFFSFGAVVSVLMWRLYCRSKAKSEVRNGIVLNHRGQNYIGRSFPLREAICDGRGKLVIDDTYWVIEGPDAEAGCQVKVVGMENMILKVKKL